MQVLPTDTRIPRDANLIGIIDDYKGLKDKLPCGLCGTMHGKGVVVCFAVNGEEHSGIMGHVCGKKYFGEGFTRIERLWKATQQNDELQASIDRFEARAVRIGPEVEAARPLLKRIYTARQKVEEAAPIVFREADHAVRANASVLSIGTRPLCALKGRQFWTGFTALAKANSILRDILLVRKHLTSGRIVQRELKGLLNSALDIERRWTEVQALMSDAMLALEAKHLHLLFGAVNQIRLERPEQWDFYTPEATERRWKLNVRMNQGVLECMTAGFKWERILDLNDPL